MKNLFFLLLISIAASIDMSAQTVTAFSQEEVRIELNNYFIELNSFLSALESLPSDFDPTSINDFEPYLADEASTRIYNFNEASEDLISYVSAYDDYHGNGSFDSFINRPTNENGEDLPTCFDTWYTNELIITGSTLGCCFSIVACPSCIAAGLVASSANMISYQNCMGQYTAGN